MGRVMTYVPMGGDGTTNTSGQSTKPPATAPRTPPPDTGVVQYSPMGQTSGIANTGGTTRPPKPPATSPAAPPTRERPTTTPGGVALPPSMDGSGGKVPQPDGSTKTVTTSDQAQPGKAEGFQEGTARKAFWDQWGKWILLGIGALILVKLLKGGTA